IPSHPIPFFSSPAPNQTRRCDSCSFDSFTFGTARVGRFLRSLECEPFVFTGRASVAKPLLLLSSPSFRFSPELSNFLCSQEGIDAESNGRRPSPVDTSFCIGDHPFCVDVDSHNVLVLLTATYRV
ncbi:hypothetical protein H100_02305, partial [Trichophyton rubrum MR850]